MACRHLHSGIALVFALALCAGGCTSNTFISNSAGGSGGSGGSAGSGTGGSSGSDGGSTGGASGSGGSAGSSTGGASGGGGSAGSSTGGASGSGGAGGTAGASGSGGAGGTGGATVDCSQQPIVFPDFIRACSGSASSCAIVSHQISCCGTMIITGINHSEKTAYEAAEALCESQYPACGCAAQPTKTDSGDTVTDPTQVQVECLGGKCTTYIP